MRHTYNLLLSQRVLAAVLSLSVMGCDAVVTPSTGESDDSLQGATSAAVAVPADYDGDGITDIAVKDPNGVWYIDFGSNGYGNRWDAAYWGYGGSAAVPVPADYDHDGKADLAVLDTASGTWYIDFSANGFGAWDWWGTAYGTAVTPVPGDYDGDGYADIAIMDSSGCWYIDYASVASGKFAGWNFIKCYGESGATAVPADYDGDGKIDIAIKDSSSSGCWKIDYAVDGFNGWNWTGCGYGATSSGFAPVRIRADYDGDGKYDIAQKDAGGAWYIDYASNGFGGWGAILNNGYGGTSVPVPGSYHHDGVDLSVYDGAWHIDYASNGFSSWDLTIPISGRSLYDGSLPYIYGTQVYAEGDLNLGGLSSPSSVPTTPNLTIGVRYTADVILQPGTQPYTGTSCSSTAPCPTNYQCEYPPGSGTGTCNATVGVEVNSDLGVPQALNLVNPTGTTFGDIPKIYCMDAYGQNGCTRVGGCADDSLCAAPLIPLCVGCSAAGMCNATTHFCNVHRRFSITCSQAGNFPLGFQLRSTSSRINPDYGIRSSCTSGGYTGLHGRVTARAQDGHHVYKAGALIPVAHIQVGSWGYNTTDGTWSYPGAPQGVPLTVTISASGYSNAIAVNVTVPVGSGTEIDASLEEDFSQSSTWLARGMSYSTYIDYSRGRTLVHAVTMPTASASLRLESAGAIPYPSLLAIANGLGAASVALINGGEFNPDASSYGYFYSHDVLQPSTLISDPVTFYASPYPTVLESPNYVPMLTIRGTGTGGQTLGMANSEVNFLSTTSSQWNQVSGTALWDNSPRDGISDINYALQSLPFLLYGNAVINSGIIDSGGDADMAWARSAVGISSNHAYLVIADGEGVMGGNGATASQLGNLFKNQLGATSAMNLDSGLSTELVLYGASGQRHVNTITGEDSRIQVDPYMGTLSESNTSYGSVPNYIRAGQ